jgi:hypothetical protein
MKHITMVVMAAVGMVGCGGQTEKQGSPLLHGHYEGVLTSGGVGLSINGVVSDEGDVVLYSSNGEFFYGGVLGADQDGGVRGVFSAYSLDRSLTTNFAIYGSYTGAISDFDGAAVTRQGISGFTTAGAGVARLDIAFNRSRSDVPGTVSSLAGDYSGVDGDSFWNLNVTAGGVITGADDLGCAFDGVAGLNAGTNTYAIRELEVDCGDGAFLVDGVAYRTSRGIGLSLYGDDFVVIGDLQRTPGGP